MNPRLILCVCAAFALLSPAIGHAQPGPTTPAEKKYVPYRITRGDVVSISIQGEPDLTVGQKRVESTGTINLAYVGDVRLVGLTIKEAQELIEQAYITGRVLRHPSVNVVVDQYAQRLVRISGLVNQQGPIELPPDSEMTIAELISKAGGFRETARGSAVRVTRTMPDGKQETFELDVESAIKGRQNRTSNQGAFIMEPGDIVYVPEKII
jgi:polysaccharide export outer membrane protein